MKPTLFPNQQRNDTCVYELRLEIGKALAQWKDCTLTLLRSAWLILFSFKSRCGACRAAECNVQAKDGWKLIGLHTTFLPPFS